MVGLPSMMKAGEFVRDYAWFEINQLDYPPRKKFLKISKVEEGIVLEWESVKTPRGLYLLQIHPYSRG